MANLYLFIDWLIGLSKPLEVEYLDEVYELEEKMKMSYVSFAERRGIEKGKVDEKVKVAKRLLEEKVSLAFIKK